MRSLVLLRRMLLVALAAWIAWEIRQKGIAELLQGPSRYNATQWIVLAGMFCNGLLSWGSGALHPFRTSPGRVAAKEMLLAFLQLVLLGLLAFFLQQHLISRTWLLLWCLLCGLLLALDSLVLYSIFQGRKPRVLIVGQNEFAGWLADWIRVHLPHYQLLESESLGGVQSAILKREPEEILLTEAGSQHLEDWVQVVERTGLSLKIRDMSWLAQTLKNPSALQNYRDFLYRLLETPGSRDAYFRLKRMMDIILSLSSAPIWLPVLLVGACLLRLTQSGSILYSHYRVGEMGVLFRCYKFRTLRESGDGGKPNPNDVNLTPLGWFFRRSSLDELPQMLNVLRGEMSLVGPRPELPAIVSRAYGAYELKRMLLKPGVTGLWQIHGRKQPIHSHLKYDFYYLRHQSLSLDLWILLRTIPAVLLKRGAR